MKESSTKQKPTCSPAMLLAGLIAAGMVLSGCTTVPPYQQSFLSKPNMQFEDAIVYNTEPRFQGSYEPGSPSASGAGATGCAACR